MQARASERGKNQGMVLGERGVVEFSVQFQRKGAKMQMIDETKITFGP